MSLVVPPGTRVVSRHAVVIRETNARLPAGAVGVIVKSPADATHAYRVRFPDASEASLQRDEFRILESVKEAATTDAAGKLLADARALSLAARLSDVQRLDLSSRRVARDLVGGRRADHASHPPRSLATLRDDNSGGIKWKHAMHLIRLLLSGIIVLREHVVPVHVSEHRDRLLAIRRGELTWEEVNAWRIELHRRFDEALVKA